jgi:uncharacterized tellurite resistance protein B-like protein
MATSALQVNLLDDLKNETGAMDVGGEKIQLTPYLILACALLYMVASDGELSAEESSHLQSVLGGDEEVLRYGVHFVQTMSLDGFLIDAPELLSTKDKWCILANVCDALLSDGHADQAELAQFARLRHAFGVSDKQFDTFFKTLKLKNDKSTLGRYAGVREERQHMTPHLALACALLYMMTSDGSIGSHEVGQLDAVIGEFEGLQKVALTYVRTVKMKAFLDEASVVLTPEQKLYILTNVCDSMLADGEVANVEDKLFLSMLRAFGYNEASFARFHQVLEAKNVKPFDTSQFKNRVTHERIASNEEPEGEVFDNKLSTPKLASALDALRHAKGQGGLISGAAEMEMSQFISRQMQDNKQSLANDFDGKANMAKVERNATDGLNLQQIDASSGDLNRQTIESAVPPRNDQLIETDVAEVNRQAIEVDAVGPHTETIEVEVRAQNIQQVVGQVNKRLDHFEASNFSFLQIGRAQKFTDDFVLVEEDASGVNRQLLGTSPSRMGRAVDSAQVESGAASVSALATSVAVVTDDVQGLSHRQPTSGLSSWLSHQDDGLLQVEPTKSNLQNNKSPAGLRLYRGDANSMSRQFVFPYKQVAVALAAMVFATPIYTRPAQSRGVAGPLVMLQERAPDMLEHQHALDTELADLPKVR